MSNSGDEESTALCLAFQVPADEIFVTTNGTLSFSRYSIYNLKSHPLKLSVLCQGAGWNEPASVAEHAA
eukprot:2590693-Rhodomonas_salina.1